MSEPIRLQKWMALSGTMSRREAERAIQDGRVAVNGETVLELGIKINPEEDHVTLDRRPMVNQSPPKVYWLLNKPDRVLTTREDVEGRTNIYQLAKLKKLSFLVSPVGRLDYRTEGLLLLSNDGAFIEGLSHPRFKVPRHYAVLISGKLTEAQEAEFRAGVPLEDGMTSKSELIFAHGQNLGRSRGSWYFVTIHEGRNRMVRRMFQHFGYEVARLVRTGFGPLRLPQDLKPGSYRQLTKSELRMLKKLYQDG